MAAPQPPERDRRGASSAGDAAAQQPAQALVDATRAWLESHPETPALRRLVIENLAGVERALRVQARDAA